MVLRCNQKLVISLTDFVTVSSLLRVVTIWCFLFLSIDATLLMKLDFPVPIIPIGRIRSMGTLMKPVLKFLKNSRYQSIWKVNGICDNYHLHKNNVIDVCLSDTTLNSTNTDYFSQAFPALTVNFGSSNATVCILYNLYSLYTICML